MKSQTIAFIIFFLTFFQCGESAKLENKNEKNKINENMSVNTKTDIEADFDITLFKKGEAENGITFAEDTIKFEYSLSNKSDKDYVIFNQGHSGRDKGATVYAEPTSKGIIEFSQKAFTEPKDKNCPERLIPIIPRGKLLKSGESFSETIYFQKPFKLNTPYDDCSPQEKIPANTDRGKFCIGFAESKNVSVDEKGNISNLKIIEKQKTICSKEFEIK